MKVLAGSVILTLALSGAAWLRPIAPPKWRPVPAIAAAPNRGVPAGPAATAAALGNATASSEQVVVLGADALATSVGLLASAESTASAAEVAQAEVPFGRPDPLGGTLCPEGMVWVSGSYCAMPPEFVGERRCPVALLTIGVCMDAFEYPNQAGVLPAVMLRGDEARQLCAAEGKRLCRESEWTFACRSTHAVSACNFGQSAEIRVERLWSGPLVSREIADSDGRRPSFANSCVDAFGVYDLLGNVQEWAESEMNDYDVTLKGGRYNQSSAECERSVHTTDPWLRFPHTGLRCCRDPLVALPTR